MTEAKNLEDALLRAHAEGDPLALKAYADLCEGQGLPRPCVEKAGRFRPILWIGAQSWAYYWALSDKRGSIAHPHRVTLDLWRLLRTGKNSMPHSPETPLACMDYPTPEEAMRDLLQALGEAA